MENVVTPCFWGAVRKAFVRKVATYVGFLEGNGAMLVGESC